MNTYQVVTTPKTNIFGKRMGGIVARLESEWSSNVIAAEAQTATEAKAELINKLGRLAANDERAYIFCRDGKTVLVVSYAGEAWQYDITSADRSHRCGCIMPNVSSFREAKERACEHAEQSYGGVITVN